MKRWVVLAMTAAAAVIGAKVLVEDVLGLDLEEAARSWIERPGPASACAIVGLLAADIAIPVPSSIVMVLSGAVFGVVQGTLLSLAGSMAGAWIGFEVARRLGRPACVRLVGDATFGELETFFARHGVAAVMITRALPIAMEATSIVAGLSRMGRVRFLSAALVGTAPVAYAYAYAGALTQRTGSLLPVLVLLLVVATAWIGYRSRLRRAAARLPD